MNRRADSRCRQAGSSQASSASAMAACHLRAARSAFVRDARRCRPARRAGSASARSAASSASQPRSMGKRVQLARRGQGARAPPRRGAGGSAAAGSGAGVPGPMRASQASAPSGTRAPRLRRSAGGPRRRGRGRAPGRSRPTPMVWPRSPMSLPKVRYSLRPSTPTCSSTQAEHVGDHGLSDLHAAPGDVAGDPDGALPLAVDGGGVGGEDLLGDGRRGRRAAARGGSGTATPRVRSRWRARLASLESTLSAEAARPREDVEPARRRRRPGGARRRAGRGGWRSPRAGPWRGRREAGRRGPPRCVAGRSGRPLPGCPTFGSRSIARIRSGSSMGIEGGIYTPSPRRTMSLTPRSRRFA